MPFEAQHGGDAALRGVLSADLRFTMVLPKERPARVRWLFMLLELSQSNSTCNVEDRNEAVRPLDNWPK